MCFTVPLKVLHADQKIAIVEGKMKVKLGIDLRVKEGDYLQVLGNIAVGKMSAEDGIHIRKLIKSINSV